MRVFQCLVWANCTQFQKKEGLLGWVERALTALPFIAALSFIQTHKGCVRGGRRGHYLSSQPQKKVPGESGYVPTSWAIRVLLPEPHPTSQRENPAEIALSSNKLLWWTQWSRLGYSIRAQSLCQCLPLFLSLSSMFSVCAVYLNTHKSARTHLLPLWFELNRQQRKNGPTGSNNLLQNTACWHCVGETDSEGEKQQFCERKR